MIRFEKEVVVLRNHKSLIIFLVLNKFLMLLIYYSIPFLSAMVLHIPVKPSMYLDMLALSSFVAMVNAFLPMPGSAGGTEATFILMFSTLFTRNEAASIMLLWRLVTFYQVLINGSIVYIYARMKPAVPLEETFVPVTYSEKMKEEDLK